MATVFVEFSDSTEQTILAAFAVQQPGSAYANLGSLDSSDPRWKTYYSALPVSAQISLPQPG